VRSVQKGKPVPVQNTLAYMHLLVSGTRRWGDHVSAPVTCGSARALCRFESHV
jgi:hypothetical protein